MEVTEVQADTTCGSLLRELQHVWDEVGESDNERDKMLLQLEQECLEVYRRKVEQASQAKALLHRALADAEAEASSLVSILGDRIVVRTSEKRGGTLKEQLAAVQPQLEELQRNRDARLKQFTDVKAQIHNILTELSGSSQFNDPAVFPHGSEQDLSLRRLDEYNSHLQALQKEKADRLQKVADYIGVIYDLCSVLGIEAMKILSEVDSSLVKSEDTSISDSTLSRLNTTVQTLEHERKQRIRKLQTLGASLIELWNLMDTPPEEQRHFRHITCLAGTVENESFAPGTLSLDNVKEAEGEVIRLDQLKAGKIKELVMKKQVELEGIFIDAHIASNPDTTRDKIMAAIDSGLFDTSELLTSMDQRINDAKKEALSRKEVLEKLEKWMLACDEETWLEEYNRDENRYNAGRGAHINLKRAEKARAAVQKLPALVDALTTKTKAWEEEHGKTFLYDGMGLLDILDEHNQLRKEKEQEQRRLRDQKRLQEQQINEQETLFGSRPSPIKPLSAKKGLSLRANGNSPAVASNRRLSLGGAMLHTGNAEFVQRKNGLPSARLGSDGKRDKTRPTAPVNYVALPKEDVTPLSSVNGPETGTPWIAA